MSLGKVPYSEGASSVVNRWISESALQFLAAERAALETEGDASALRRRSLTATLPLGGGEQTYGFYSAEVHIGTPEQDVVLLMDTGSSDLAVNLVCQRMVSVLFSSSLC
mgnify:FL=1